MSTKTRTDDGLETYINKGGIKVVERFFDLPLDYSNPKSGQTIRIFARNLIPTNKAKTEEEQKKLPYFAFLQGGPGFEIALPGARGDWVSEIHERGYQTLFMDSRGTGLSTPLSHETLPSHVKTDEQIAEYFKLFRADSIVRDLEEIRKILLGQNEKPEDRKWSIIGQSFGGFCSVTYASLFPDSLKEVFITGGIPPLINNPDRVYETTIRTVIKRNKIYYEKYPRDVERVRKIVEYISNNQITLPNGGNLTAARFQVMGLALGGSGGIDNIHQLVLRAANDLELFGKFAFKTLQMMERPAALDDNPIYAILHEPCYCQGEAANWSAARHIDKHPEYFSWDKVKSLGEEAPLYFRGEQIIPQLYDDFVTLRPLKGAAEILARDKNWSKLYDLDQLSKNTVPISATTYYDDMFVDFNLAQESASKIGNISQYITNQFAHNGIHQDPKDVISKMFELSKRLID